MTNSQANAILSKLKNMNIKHLTKEQQEEIAKMIVEALKLFDK